MKLKTRDNRLHHIILIVCLILLIGSINIATGDETKWIAVGMLHDWYSSLGCEIEVGRRHLVPDQQDGLIWPAQFRYQDSKAAKALWIGATNYNDPLVDRTFNYKVVHIGPRVWDEQSESMPVEFKMIGRFDHPNVLVDGVPASNMVQMDVVDEIDETLPADRMIYNVVNTSIGITLTRRIYAFSQQNHDNYFIYDYIFKNTGICNKDGSITHEQTLEGVYFFFQYRYAPSREGGPYGDDYWLPQSTSWGHNTMNDARNESPPYSEDAPPRCLFSWHGLHSKAAFDNIGGPYGGEGGDGHLGAAQYVGVVTIHADKSATDNSDDPYQPTTTQYLGSDEPITSGNDQFNDAKMTVEYEAMTAGHPEERHADAVGDGYADEWGGTPGGYSHGQGFGPYTIAPGDSIHIVIAEGVAGLCRDSCYTIGARWLEGTGPFILPDGSTTNDKDEYKKAWVYTGQDSLFQTLERAIATYDTNFIIPQPPSPPDYFEVNSGGDRITLTWSNSAESWPNFGGYKIYRAIHVPDTTYEEIFACGVGTNHPEIVYEFLDTSPVRGFDYYYYIVSFEDDITNDVDPGVRLESSMFYTMTNEPAYLRRPPGEKFADIRIVPNPYNIRARELQYGASGPDRIMFLNIPPVCTIKIFTERGDLIQTIEHTDGTGDEAWNSVTSSRQVVVSGVYIAVFETPDGKKAIKKFIIIR
ncbi:fibronectin [candidate division KSB1 bacterium]|nr:fibronectin [candidate division KSB1 bacterium]